MIKNIPLFPLKLVVYPGERLNLHIFEERYKQMVADSIGADNTFGICVYLDKIMPVGTEVRLTEIVKKYDDGRMDISTVALDSFELISFVNPLQDKLYAGGAVKILKNDPLVSPNLYEDYISLLGEFFKLIDYKIDLVSAPVNSYTYAHSIGLKIEEEYELLLIKQEEKRLLYLIRHLINIIPVVKEIEEAKRKIKLNGHFKLLDPLDF